MSNPALRIASHSINSARKDAAGCDQFQHPITLFGALRGESRLHDNIATTIRVIQYVR
jgi:hypothetical protein